MGLERIEENGKFAGWAWTGTVRDLVNTVGSGDARLGFVIDKKSGAKISMNISGTDEPAEEPFYIESPDGEDLYDAYSRKEAELILKNIRAGEEYPDVAKASIASARHKTTKKRGKSRRSKPSGFGGVR